MSDLVKMARVLEKMAQELRREAMAFDKSKGEHDRFRANSERWPADYAELIETGSDPETAILQIAVRDAAPVDTVAWHVRQAAREDARQGIEARNREILRLARTGWTNKEIGKKFSLHHVTVSRIIARAMRG